MKKFYGVLFFLFLAGCAAYVTPEGTFIEPLPAILLIEPYVALEPPPHIHPRPLPPVSIVPDRHLYNYGNLYYYYWSGVWYYSDRDRGPWYRLQPKYYPPRYRRR